MPHFNKKSCTPAAIIGAGFSLIELSVVIVVLSLLTGAILTGHTLIKAARLRSITEEFSQWQSAVGAFKDKYQELPGDMPNAIQHWGDATSGGSTWNGDGNGFIDYGAAAGVQGEVFTFWQHLALAGMISGEYTGIAGPASNEDSFARENVPGTKFSEDGGWGVFYTGPGGAYTADWYDIDYGNTYQVGGKITDWEYGDYLLTPDEAWNIDTKFDDGNPAKGLVIARYWNNICAAADDSTHAADDLEASYKLTENSPACALGFRKAF